MVEVLALAALAALCCGSPPETEAVSRPVDEAGPRADAASPSADGASQRAEWAIAIHGGAGSMTDERIGGREAEYRVALERALKLGADMLRDGAASLDTVEAVVRAMEDDALFNAGKGAVYTHERTHELDASIMEGRTLRCGAVAGLRTVKNPITLARRVMEKTPHVLLAGDGAEAFASTVGVEIVDPSYFSTPARLRELERELADEAATGVASLGLGTVGAVALDRAGDLAAGTSTGGRTNKRFGRVGDVPVIGAGTYADNRTCAVSGTGKGEEMIRHFAAANVSARMALGGRSLEQAVREVIDDVLQPEDGGLIAVGRDGTLVLHWNTGGMFRGAADARGRFEVGIR
jgi:beta-aspartyl-peptidase (threonine type)